MEKLPNAELLRRKRVWCDKWLRIQTLGHPHLEALESAAYAFCGGVWQSPLFGGLLVIYGDNGNGKTHVAKAIDNWIKSVGHGRQFMVDNHHTTLHSIFWPWPALLDAFKSGQWDLVTDLNKVPVLILDELGGGHDPSQVGTDKLCQVLSARERKWTLVTTNATPEEWAAKFDKRVASRLFRNSQIVDLSQAPDFALVMMQEHPVI